MSDGNRTTLVVAVAGIAATALVGLAGTTAAWLSARDDRAAQRTLAREERTYNRRVSAYLDAVDFVEGQRRSLLDTLGQLVFFFDPRGLSHEEVPVLPDFVVPNQPRSLIPYRNHPPSRLTSRLRAFGSPEAFTSFQKAQILEGVVPNSLEFNPRNRTWYIQVRNLTLDKTLVDAYKEFSAQIFRFETVVHDELGVR